MLGGVREMMPEPSLQRVQEECGRFARENEVAEKTVALVFSQFPCNTVLPEIHAKVVVLNEIYHARVRSIDLELLSRYILKCQLDPLLDQCSTEAVECIMSCPTTVHYYSFPTKYCAWHRPSTYPMWDGNVEEALWRYQKQFRFYEFKREQLGSYPKLKEVVIAFRKRFGLESLDFKRIDEFLWQVGSKIKEQTDQIPV